jgi:hypothetical protein
MGERQMLPMQTIRIRVDGAERLKNMACERRPQVNLSSSSCMVDASRAKSLSFFWVSR